MGDILLVDDDLDYAESFSEILILHGHAVRLACNGEDGLRQLNVRTPELILLDVDMPVLGGPEMAWRMFLSDAGKEKVPILFISANPYLQQIAARVGTTYFLAKPFDLRVLLAALDRALAERSAPSWPGR